MDAVPLAAVAGTQIDISAGNEQAPEWVDLGMRLLAAFGAQPSPSTCTPKGSRRRCGTCTPRACRS